MNRRRKIFESPDEPAVDWATAEELAFASILSDGIPIRMSGEDVVRGTFSQRHAAFYDVEQRHKTYLPLHHIPQVKASFEIINSPLTENAAVGYEFGYNIQAPEQLVIWEAQYGDFANLAQIMVDEFVVSGRAKWGLTPSLALLLPHGNEGQGPDHSSGRLERYLQLAAENNMRIAYPTTSAQYFHLLRRQAALLKTDPLPLVVFTPKGLLRHPHTASTPDELSQGGWMAAIDDPRTQQDPKEIQRLMFCTGRIYVDLVTSDHREKATRLAIARIEQLYPFPDEAVNGILDRYPNLVEVDWIQEEPQNMGAWEFVRPRLQEIIEDRWPLHYIGRPPSSSPAEGSAAWYHATQQTLIAKAFDHQQKADVISSDLIDERG
jgi:2-oxoglutarate dehydrogenase E1 component